MVLLFLESLGTTELLVILVVALVLFGPRRLPEMTRKVGKSINEFKRASDDFKRTWEREVALESVEREAAIERAMVAEPHAAEAANGENGTGASEQAALPHDITAAAYAPVQGATVARGAERAEPFAATAGTEAASGAAAVESETTEPSAPRKTDWL